MRYAAARQKENFRETAYRNYVTDALFAVVNGGHFQFSLTKRFADIFDPTPVPNEDKRSEDNRSMDEIVDAVWSGFEGKKAVSE